VIRVLGVAVLLLLPPAAHAQGNSGPFGGLFGRTPERIGREFTAFDLRTSFGGQYDDAIYGGDSLQPGGPLRSGVIGGVNTALGFQRETDRTTVKLTSSVTHQEYVRDRFGATSLDAGAEVSGKLTTRLTLDAGANYLRSPFFHLQPSLARPSPLTAIAIPNNPHAVRALITEGADGRVGFSSQYTKRSTLSMSISRRQVRFVDEPGSNFAANALRATWRRRTTRSFSLRAGYGREDIHQNQAAGAEYTHEVIDVGADFDRELSLTRRTTLSFNTQTSIIKEGRRRYRLNGHLGLTKYFQRTWRVSVSGVRDTEFLPGFDRPLFSDAVVASVSGMVARRSDWSTMVSAGRGEFGFDETPGRFTTATATTRLNLAVSRHIGVFADYSLYFFKLPPQSTGLAGVGQMNRQTITLGMTAWLPIINHMRAPRDPE
jgi:hypothetical protein